MTQSGPEVTHTHTHSSFLFLRICVLHLPVLVWHVPSSPLVSVSCFLCFVFIFPRRVLLCVCALFWSSQSCRTHICYTWIFPCRCTVMVMSGNRRWLPVLLSHMSPPAGLYCTLMLLLVFVGTYFTATAVCVALWGGCVWCLVKVSKKTQTLFHSFRLMTSKPIFSPFFLKKIICA